MILGIGTDIVEISRIKASIDKNPHALSRRVLRDRELENFARAHRPEAFLAKRFAAKEAASKAFGTGIGKIAWHDLEVINDDLGAPSLLCFGNAKIMLERMAASQVHLSLADEREAALAFVVISKD